MYDGKRTPEEIPAWEPVVLQPSLVLLEYGHVSGENRILIFPSFDGFPFHFLMTFVNVFSLQL